VDQVATVASPVLPDQPGEGARRALVEHRLPRSHTAPELLRHRAQHEDAEREGRERVAERDARGGERDRGDEPGRDRHRERAPEVLRRRPPPCDHGSNPCEEEEEQA